MRVTIPQDLTAQTPPPDLPLAGATQKDAARYVLEMEDALQACQARLVEIENLTAPAHD